MFKKILMALVVVLSAPGALARQGCCSGHGGVCGCECCDGSRLSGVCSPYYPECKNEVASKSHDRDRMSPFKNGRDLLNGWKLAAGYALLAVLLLYFVRIKHKVKK